MNIQYLIFTSISSGLACAGVSFYFNANRKDIPWGGVLGFISWFLYLVVKYYSGSAALGYFVGTLAVSFLSEILAFTLHNPATVYLLPALLPLVPGAGIFLMMRSLVLESLEAGLARFYEVMGASGSIALGVAISSSIFKVIHQVRRRNRERKALEKLQAQKKEQESFEKAMEMEHKRASTESPEEDGSF